MERLLPKYDYFKHTTRVVLTEQEKQETVAAVERAGQYLGRMSSISRFEYTSFASGREVLRSIHNSGLFFSRWVSLVKGSTQPRQLYRRAAALGY